MSNQKDIEFLAASARSIKSEGAKQPQVVPSPCRSVCQMDESTGLCLGCLRTLDEIVDWGNADNDYKRGVWLAIEARIGRYAT